MFPNSVYLLVPLKHTLKRLSLATNPDVTSESTPALLLLAHLEFLSICDTGVDMTGLRLVAKTILDDNRTIDIEIPYACEEYIDSSSPSLLVSGSRLIDLFVRPRFAVDVSR